MDEQSLQELVERLRLVGTDQQQVEVKSAVGKSVLETLSAFSNGAGGIVLIGWPNGSVSLRCRVSMLLPSETRCFRDAPR